MSFNSPNTFIIGVQKAGTTALYDWLSQHPDIYAPSDLKDFHFFSIDKYYKKGEQFFYEKYRDQNIQKIKLSAGVNYIQFKFAIERIKKYNKDSKLILVLRDPVKRAFSAYNYFFKLGIENLSFNDSLKRELNGENNSILEKSNLSYINHGKYFEKIKMLYQHFQEDQVLIMFYEEIIADKEKAMNNIFQFLEIEQSVKINFTFKNQTGKPIFRGINKILLSDNYLKSFLKYIGINKLLSYEKANRYIQEIIRINTNNANKAEINIEQYQLIKKYFEKDVAHLSTLLNKDLNTLWKF